MSRFAECAQKSARRSRVVCVLINTATFVLCRMKDVGDLVGDKCRVVDRLSQFVRCSSGEAAQHSYALRRAAGNLWKFGEGFNVGQPHQEGQRGNKPPQPKPRS